MKKILCVFVLFGIIINAQTSEQVLKDYIKKAKKHIVIDIDKVKKVEPKIEFIYQFNPNETKNDLIIITPASLTIFDNKIYVTDAKQNNIKIFNRDGKYLTHFGREGKGPGEFINPWQIKSNDKYLFVNDSYNSRIQIFDNKLNYVYSIRSTLFFNDEMIADNDYIYIQNNFSYADNKNNIFAYKLEKPYEEQKNHKFDFAPIFSKKRDTHYLNNILFSFDNNFKYILYKETPYLFIFNKSNNLEISLELKQKETKKVNKKTSLRSFDKNNIATTVKDKDNRKLYTCRIKESLNNIYVLLPSGDILQINKNNYLGEYLYSFKSKLQTGINDFLIDNDQIIAVEPFGPTIIKFPLIK